MPEALRLFLPNRAGWFFFLLLALFLFGRPIALLSDGDICRHVLTGLYFFQNHSLPHTNYICAVLPNAPWMTNSAVADLSYAAAFQLFGLNGIILVAAMAISLALTASYQLARLRGLGPIVGLLLLCLATSVASLHWLARPHVFTWLFFVISYYLVFVCSANQKIRIGALALIGLIWANMHGSIYLLIGMVGCKLVGDLLQPKTESQEGVRPADSFLTNVVALVCVAIASSINTRGGAGFLGYILSYMGSGATANSEWRNIDFSLGVPVWCFVLLVFCVIAIWTYSASKPRLCEFGFALVLLAFSLYAMRMMPYFALLALPVVAISWLSLRDRFTGDSLGARAFTPAGGTESPGADRHSVSKTESPGGDRHSISTSSDRHSVAHRIATRLFLSDARAGNQEPSSWTVTAVFCVASAVAAIVWLSMPQFKITDFDPLNLPVSCTNYIKQNHITGLGFTQDNWASYLYWKNGEPIFIDDYTDLYPPELVRAYTTIYFTYPGWQAVLDKYKFHYILIPRGLPLAQLLLADPRWKRVCEDPASMLFIRK